MIFTLSPREGRKKSRCKRFLKFPGPNVEDSGTSRKARRSKNRDEETIRGNTMTIVMTELGRKDSKLRAPRIEPDVPLCIQAKTLGTAVGYFFDTRNISKTGLLIEQNQPRRVPFLINTLVEIIIDREGNWLDKPIACIAKVVRIVEPGMDSAAMHERFGLRIVQIEKENGEIWEASVAKLAKKLGFIEENFNQEKKRLVS